MRNKRDKKTEELDFEIKFYEGLLKKRPNFIQGLIVLGDAYTKRGLYKEGLEIDQQLTKLKPDEPIVFYNLACSYSLLGLIEESWKALNKAIDLGYDDFSYMNKDADLENLRRDPRYKEIFFKIKK